VGAWSFRDVATEGSHYGSAQKKIDFVENKHNKNINLTLAWSTQVNRIRALGTPEPILG